MKTGVFFGYKCPKCGSKTDIAVMVGSDEIICQKCEIAMKPNHKAKVSTANAYCPNCNSSYGLINSDKCPKCGARF